MRLIDADAIDYTYTTIRSDEDGHNWRVFAIGQDEIDDMPTVDAVPVVRCRECIRWQGKDDGNAAPCSWDWYNKDPEWYCPRGKRREDGQDDD